MFRHGFLVLTGTRSRVYSIEYCSYHLFSRQPSFLAERLQPRTKTALSGKLALIPSSKQTYPAYSVCPTRGLLRTRWRTAGQLRFQTALH